MSAVVDEVVVVSGSVGSAKLQEGAQFDLECVQAQSAGGVVTAKCLDKVVREKALDSIEC